MMGDEIDRIEMNLSVIFHLIQLDEHTRSRSLELLKLIRLFIYIILF